jgi:hypothetical protein
MAPPSWDRFYGVDELVLGNLALAFVAFQQLRRGRAIFYLQCDSHICSPACTKMVSLRFFPRVFTASPFTNPIHGFHSLSRSNSPIVSFVNGLTVMPVVILALLMRLQVAWSSTGINWTFELDVRTFLKANPIVNAIVAGLACVALLVARWLSRGGTDFVSVGLHMVLVLTATLHKMNEALGLSLLGLDHVLLARISISLFFTSVLLPTLLSCRKWNRHGKA